MALKGCTSKGFSVYLLLLQLPLIRTFLSPSLENGVYQFWGHWFWKGFLRNGEEQDLLFEYDEFIDDESVQGDTTQPSFYSFAN